MSDILQVISLNLASVPFMLISIRQDIELLGPEDSSAVAIQWFNRLITPSVATSVIITIESLPQILSICNLYSSKDRSVTKVRQIIDS